MILLSVWMTVPDGETMPAGELACSDPDGSGLFASEFEYAESWLRSPQAFPLDPLSLPMRRGRFAARNLEPPLAVFDDALPDDWGRMLLARQFRLPRGRQGTPFLLRALGGRHKAGIGAMRFTEGAPAFMQSPPADITDLAALASAAESFDAGLAGDPRGLQLLFAAGSSLGGARPKALVDDGEHRWIAKFRSVKRDGRFDVVGLEATGLDLAANAGIRVPAHELRMLGKSTQRALLVERFDAVGERGRRHMISLRTLCKERPGAWAPSYGEPAEAVRQVSAAPREDVDRFYRQMVFNAAFGNTDDHLKNFWMLHDRDGYRLSPAFDLVPDVGERREHTLAFEYEHQGVRRSAMLRLAERWGVRHADDIIDAVLDSMADFGTTAQAHAVPDENIEEIGADIVRRVARLRAV
jgi:serine/threonine-protein kinase HipA